MLEVPTYEHATPNGHLFFIIEHIKKSYDLLKAMPFILNSNALLEHIQISSYRVEEQDQTHQLHCLEK